MSDSAGVVLADQNGVVLGTTEAGQLKVDTAPVAPPGTTFKAHIASEETTVTETSEYLITNGKTLAIQQFSGGSEASVTGGRVELWHEPDADPGNDILVAVGYANGTSFEQTINQEFVGNGIAQISVRRVNMSGGDIHMTGRWCGYEKA